MSKCFESEMKGGGGFFGSMGFGGASAAASAHSCDTSSENEATQNKEIMSSTIISRQCMSNARKCPAADKTFIAGLQASSNWAVIDRKMQKCVSIWDALRRDRHEKEVVAVLAEANIDKDKALQLIERFGDTANKIWHLRVLKLPELCIASKPAAKISVECQKMAKAAASGGDELKKISLHEISQLWDKMIDAAGQDKEASEKCAALDF